MQPENLKMAVTTCLSSKATIIIDVVRLDVGQSICGNDNLTPAFLYFEVAFGSITALFVSLGRKHQNIYTTVRQKKKTFVSFVRLTKSLRSKTV